MLLQSNSNSSLILGVFEQQTLKNYYPFVHWARGEQISSVSSVVSNPQDRLCQKENPVELLKCTLLLWRPLMTEHAQSDISLCLRSLQQGPFPQALRDNFVRMMVLWRKLWVGVRKSEISRTAIIAAEANTADHSCHSSAVLR